MQEGLTTLPQWAQTTLQVVASVFAGVGLDRIYNTWLNRKKPAAEINVTEATATEIRVRASASAGEAVIRMLDRLDGAQVTIDRLRDERDHWERKAGDLQRRMEQAEDDARAAELFVGQLNAAAKLTTCEHYPTGVKLSDYTPKQLNPPTKQT